ncbi:hypothetical protein K440DRAFT_658511 [Wilcoxina mikolae CBS 423.85]|nr:hypothetical protein K440DRAFT_658511 [Wilcoxina mikolae CBS 423.85]
MPDEMNSSNGSGDEERRTIWGELCDSAFAIGVVVNRAAAAAGEIMPEKKMFANEFGMVWNVCRAAHAALLVYGFMLRFCGQLEWRVTAVTGVPEIVVVVSSASQWLKHSPIQQETYAIDLQKSGDIVATGSIRKRCLRGDNEISWRSLFTEIDDPSEWSVRCQ